MSIEKNGIDNLLKDVVNIVEQAKKQVVVQANSTLTLMFWQIGSRIRTENLEGNRAEYGKEIIKTISTELVSRFGVSFNEKKPKANDTIC